MTVFLRAWLMAKILVSVTFIVFAALIPVWASMDPIMLGDHIVFVRDWSIEEPQFLSIGKFGVRRGHYRLKFNDSGKIYELPIYTDQLSRWRNDRSLFADWKSQDILSKIESHKGHGLLKVSFQAWGNNWVTIKKVDYLKDLPDYLDLPPNQDGWQYLTSRSTELPSNQDFYFDQTTVSLILICYVCLLPTNLFLWFARKSVKPYFKF